MYLYPYHNEHGVHSMGQALNIDEAVIQEQREAAFQNLLQDPDFMWEAVSVDGVQYPFPTNYMLCSKERRLELKRQQNEFDGNLAKKIGQLVKDKDDAELGRIFREQIEAYAKSVLIARGF